MAEQTFKQFLSSFAKAPLEKIEKGKKDAYFSDLRKWRGAMKTLQEMKRTGKTVPEGMEEWVSKMGEALDEREPLYGAVDPQKISEEEQKKAQRLAATTATEKIGPRKKDPFWTRARRTDSARSLLGPEVDLITKDYKPAGSYIDKHGLIGAAFRPTPMVDWIPTFTDKERDSTAKKLGKGTVNALVNVFKSLGSIGGAATMGGMSAAKGLVEGGKVLKAGHRLFALDLSRNLLEHNPEVRRIYNDPNASAQEKTEAIMGQTLLALFASGAIKGSFKETMEGAKTPREALDAYNRFVDKEAAAKLDPKRAQIRLTEEPRADRGPDVEAFKERVPEELMEAKVEPLPEDLPAPELKPVLKADPLDTMKLKELKAEAAKEGIDIKGVRKKTDIADLIREHREKDSELFDLIKSGLKESKGKEWKGAKELPPDWKGRIEPPATEKIIEGLRKQKEEKPEAGSEALKKLQDISDNLEAVDSTHKRLKDILLGEKLPYSFVDLSGKVIIPANKKITGSKLRELAEMWADGRKFDIIGEGGPKGVPENLRLAVLRAVEPNYSWETMRDPIWMEAKSKVAEPSKPADPVVESLKQEKIEDVVRGEAEIAEAKEARIEAEAAGEAPRTETVKKYHMIVKRHLQRAKKAGDKEAVARMIENPDSEYNVMPTSAKADAIDIMDLGEITEQLKRLEKDSLSVEKALLDQKRLDLLWEKQHKSKVKEDLDLYEEAYQAHANESTFLGQLVQARNYFKASNPNVTVDLIAAAIKKNNGPELSAKERANLLDIISKVKETQNKADKTAKAYQAEPTDANWSNAVDSLRSAEKAKIEQLDFMEQRNPKAFADLIISFLQGNYLTPTTLTVNVFGNLVPLPARASARGVGKGIDIVEQFFFRGRREAERQKLLEEQKAEPTPENAARLEKLDRMLSPMEQMRLSPWSGTVEKMKGLLDATGIKRLYEARKVAKEKGITLKEAFKQGRSGPIKSDIISSLILGDRVNLYETGTLDATNVTAPVDAFQAGARLWKLMKDKDGEISTNTMSVAKDLTEATAGFAPTIFFRLLASGDVPFRGAEMRRLISEQGEIRGWDKKTKERAMEEPELVFGEKEWMRIKNESARASFQQENLGTRLVSKVNQWIRGKLGDTAYTAYRDKTPYQKTLVNLFGELVNYTPVGVVDVVGKTAKEGFLTKDAKISAGKVVTGTAALTLAQYLMDNDIMSADLDPYMSDSSDTKKVRYMTEQSFHHGFLNMSALKRKRDGEDTAYKRGDWLLDMRRMGPFGYILLNNANWHRHLEGLPKEEREKLEKSWAAMMASRAKMGATHSARYGINTTMATGVRDTLQGLYSIINDKGTNNKLSDQAARDLLTVFLPNTLNWFTRIKSPYRQSFKPDSFTDSLKAQWRQKVSSQWSEEELVEGYPVIADLWGTPLESVPEGEVYSALPLGEGKKASWQKTESGELDSWDRFMSSAFNIVKLKKSGAILDPYSSEVHRLWRKFSKNEAVPSLPSRSIVVDGKKYELNRDQYAYFSALVGRYRLLGKQEIEGRGTRTYLRKHDGVAQLINDPNYMDGLTDEEKVKKLIGIYGRQYEFAKKDSFEYFANPREDGLTKMFNIDIKNLPIKPEQEVKAPSGRIKSD